MSVSPRLHTVHSVHSVHHVRYNLSLRSPNVGSTTCNSKATTSTRCKLSCCSLMHGPERNADAGTGGVPVTGGAAAARDCARSGDPHRSRVARACRPAAGASLPHSALTLLGFQAASSSAGSYMAWCRVTPWAKQSVLQLAAASQCHAGATIMHALSAQANGNVRPLSVQMLTAASGVSKAARLRIQELLQCKACFASRKAKFPKGL